jgi:hypothetical protein
MKITLAALLAATTLAAPADAGSAGLSGLRQSIGNATQMVKSWWNVPANKSLSDAARRQSYTTFTSRPLARPNYKPITNDVLMTKTPAQQDNYHLKVGKYERYRRNWLKQRAADYAQWRKNPKGAPYVEYINGPNADGTYTVSVSFGKVTRSDGSCSGVGCN